MEGGGGGGGGGEKQKDRGVLCSACIQLKVQEEGLHVKIRTRLIQMQPEP